MEPLVFIILSACFYACNSENKKELLSADKIISKSTETACSGYCEEAIILKLSFFHAEKKGLMQLGGRVNRLTF